MQSTFLKLEKDWHIQNKAIHTATEIQGQPQLWSHTFDKINSEMVRIKDFLNQVLVNESLDIILTGAGTSAFIGEVLKSSFHQAFHKDTRVIATTDLITFPETFLHKSKPTLLISFARSGNSPESVAAVDIVNQICEKCYHIIITCNAEGALAKKYQGNQTLTLVLPPESNDKSLAMTGSFSAMLLTGLLICERNEIEKAEIKLKKTIQAAEKILDKGVDTIAEICKINFDRGIFLGSGALLGIATEGHLKLQELTDGKVICKNDSYLGFRHGPKAVISPDSLLVFHLSNNAHVAQYERDLIKEIFQRKDGKFRLGIGAKSNFNDLFDTFIELENCEDLPDAWLGLVSIVPAQLLGFFKSLAVGLCPDQPSVSGNISRVVQGVIIYLYNYE